MSLLLQQEYEEMTDRQLVELVTNPADNCDPDASGVAYLLNNRYEPLLLKLYYQNYTKEQDLFGDCKIDLFCYLRGNKEPWQKLKNFEWRSTFGYWLEKTARRRFVEIKPSLIGKITNALVIDGQNPRTNKIQHPIDGNKLQILNERRVMLIEAITKLRNDDQRFAINRQLQGYSSVEIAELLKKRWEKRGIVKYGYFKVKGQERRERRVVIPDETYVNSLLQHARKTLEKSLYPLKY